MGYRLVLRGANASERVKQNSTLMFEGKIQNVVLGGFLTNCCVESSMRTAYENGYNVYTLKDCSSATSIAAHENSFDHNFGMFSNPTTSDVLMKSIKSTQ